MHNLGTVALEEGGRVDFARLRTERFERVLAEMARRELDVLVLGREANARYASGGRRLWTGGTRTFGPGCVVVRATRQVNLLSVFDEVVPPATPPQNLYGITWNPRNLIGGLAQIAGAAEAARVGVDGMSPVMAQLLPLAFPKARIEAAEEAMHAVRRVKTVDEVACIR